jgi:hypothetical protein
MRFRTRQLNDWISYAEILLTYPQIRLCAGIQRHRFDPCQRNAYDTCMRILRIGPCQETSIRYKELLHIVSMLKLTTVIVAHTIPKYQNSDGMITSVWSTPYIGRDNPCRKIVFRR